jgi:integrase
MPIVLSEILRMRYQSSRWTGVDDFVFGKADGAPLNADGLRLKVLYPALKKVGIERGQNSHGFHLFRHSAASIVHEQTRDMSLAQRLLGHSRLSTTADIYAHTESEAEQATETLAREIMGICGLTVAEDSRQVN